MTEPDQIRKLTAILAADVAGYSRLMGDDEKATVQTLADYRRVFVDHITRHQGRVVDTAGDSVLATFDSPIEAVECSVEIQRELRRRNRNLADHRKMHFRIGLNLGDVIHREDGTVYGDGVNIAARLESLAEPGGVTVSGTIFDHVEGKLPESFVQTGEHQVKNISKPVRTYKTMIIGASEKEFSASAAVPKAQARRRWPLALISIAVVLVLSALAGFWYLSPSSRNAATGHDSHRTEDAQSISIAVMPFENLSGDAAQELFSDGISDEIITTLSHFRSLRVAARHNTFQYKGKMPTTRGVGEALRVRYVLVGTVRRMVETVKVTAQLVQSESGAQVWAESYEKPLSAQNVFAIQRDISLSIAAAIASHAGALFSTEYGASQGKSPTDLSAYECFMRWSVRYQNTLSKEDHRDVVQCLENAVQVDPNYSDVWAALAYTYADEYRFGYDPRPGPPLDRALQAAERAVKLAPQSQLAYWELAQVRYFRGEKDAFFAATDRAIQLNPNNPNILAALGTWVCYAGEWDKGMALVNRAIELDPLPVGWYYFPAAFSHYRKGRYEAALVEAKKIDMPSFVWAHAVRVAVYGQLGRPLDAQPSVNRILELNPDFEATARESRRKIFLYDEPLLEHFLEGLSKAGMKIPPRQS